MDQTKLPSGVTMLVDHVFKDKEVKVTDWDLDRIFADTEEGGYIIRMWDITNNYVNWTLFKEVDDHADRITDGTFKFPKL